MDRLLPYLLFSFLTSIDLLPLPLRKINDIQKIHKKNLMRVDQYLRFNYWITNSYIYREVKGHESSHAYHKPLADMICVVSTRMCVCVYMPVIYCNSETWLEVALIYVILL